MTTSKSSVERLVRVETRIEAMSSDIADIKASLLRLEGRQTEQSETTWKLYAKIAGLSATVSILSTLVLKGIL